MNTSNRSRSARPDGQETDADQPGAVRDNSEPTVVPVGLTGYTEGMTLTDEQRAAAQRPGRGSHSEPTGDVPTTYQPTVVEPGLTGFTAGLEDESATRHGEHEHG